MKLIDFSRHGQLNFLRRQMGAHELGSFAPVESVRRLTPIELDQLISGGIDVSTEDIRILDDGTLGYKDSRVLVYSRKVSLASDAGDTIWQVPRFHFANCKKLKDARQRNRWAPYVVATKEDASFAVDRVDIWGRAERAVLRLVVCEHCLHTLSFDGFSHDLPEHERRRILSSFSIWRFFKSYPKCLVVEDSVRESDAGANNGYVRDFSEFSARMKREREYRCDRCKIVLMVPSDHRFLHVIYDDEARRSRNSKNVRVLCLGCHADQPKHEQMKSLLEYREFVRRFGHARSDRPLPPRVSSAGGPRPTSSQGRTTKRSRSTEALTR